nr:hypothetical protein CFP56_58801 [Quercus suber]
MQGYVGDHVQSPASYSHVLGTPSNSSPGSPNLVGRPQTLAYALADSPSGLLAYVLDAIQPSRLNSQAVSPASSLSVHSTQHSPVASHSSRSPAAASSASREHSGSLHSPHGFEATDQRSAWTPNALVSWAMIPWLAGPEVALRWISNSLAMENSLWTGHSNVPLGISEFHSMAPNDARQLTPLPWLEAYHRVAMVRQRPGSVRFAAWEKPAEVVMDIRELANIVLMASSTGGNMTGGDRYSPGSMLPPGSFAVPVVPSQFGGSWT